jgi:hypothetical protein
MKEIQRFFMMKGPTENKRESRLGIRRFIDLSHSSRSFCGATTGADKIEVWRKKNPTPRKEKDGRDGHWEWEKSTDSPEIQ